MTEKPKHVMLSSLGIRPSDNQNMCVLNGLTRSSRFSVLALWKFLPEETRPDAIWFILTPQASKRVCAVVQQEADAVGTMVKPIGLMGTATNDTWEFLETAAERFLEDADFLPVSRLSASFTVPPDRIRGFIPRT